MCNHNQPRQPKSSRGPSPSNFPQNGPQPLAQHTLPEPVIPSLPAPNAQQTSVQPPPVPLNRVMLGIQQTPQPTSSGTFQGGRNGTSVPSPQNTSPNSSTLPKPPVPPRPTHLDWLPLELKLRLMEFSDPTDLITLWDLSESFKHALRSRHAVKTWNRMRRAAGKAFRSTRPTPQEFEVLRYALEEGCEVCNAREAPCQWHWGTRSCAGCLHSKVITRRQFLQDHGTLFKSLPGAVKKIRWFNPAEVPGLEYTQIAVNSLDPVSFENPDDVAFCDWVDAAVKAVPDVMGAKPSGSQWSIATDVEGLISGERQWRETINELRWSQEHHPWEIERLGPKRSRQIASMLLDIQESKIPFLNVAKQCEEWQKTRDPLGHYAATSRSMVLASCRFNMA